MWISVLASLLAGALFATSSLVQHRATQREPRRPDGSIRLGLLVRLIQRPDWVLGLMLAASGFGLQALALAYGSIALVQPLLVTEVLFALPAAVYLGRQRMRTPDWLATAGIVGGLALFLSVAQPTGVRRSSPSDFVWLLSGGSVIGFAAVCLIAGRLIPRLRRATLLGLAAGLLFGLQSSLLKTVTYLWSAHGVLHVISSWQPYAMATTAIAGLLCIQTAFQNGPLPQSLPALDAGEPLVAVLIGVAAFGEHLRHSPLSLGLEFAALALVLAGIVVLDRSPVILSLHNDAGPTPAPAPVRRSAAVEPSAQA
jgi:drug/metabolite transporter (DMT)-like permease